MKLIKMFLKIKLLFNSGLFFSNLFKSQWYSGPQKKWIGDLGVGPTHEVLEVGCGSGELSTWISSFAQHVVGIDRDYNKIDRATLGSSKDNLEFRTVDANGRQLTSRKFDFCVGSSILNVIKNKHLFIQGLKESCSHGGVVSFLQPSPDMNEVTVRKYLDANELSIKEKALLQMWSESAGKLNPESTKKLFEELQFQNIKIDYYFDGMLFAVSGTKH